MRLLAFCAWLALAPSAAQEGSSAAPGSDAGRACLPCDPAADRETAPAGVSAPAPVAVSTSTSACCPDADAGSSLLSPDEGVRLDAARKRRDAPGAEDMEELLARLKEEEAPAVRVELLRALNSGLRRGRRTFQAAAQLMAQDLSDQVRAAAASALLSYPEGESLALLESFLESERGAWLRRSVCLELSTAAAHRGSLEATLILGRVLVEDPDAAVRLAALEALELRGDPRAAPALQRAAAAEKDAALRRRMAAAVKKSLEAASAVRPQKPRQPSRVSPDAVKGVDFCGDGNGWCECRRGPTLKPRPRCIPRQECVFLYENSYMRLGYTCTWDGANLD